MDYSALQLEEVQTGRRKECVRPRMSLSRTGKSKKDLSHRDVEVVLSVFHFGYCACA